MRLEQSVRRPCDPLLLELVSCEHAHLIACFLEIGVFLEYLQPDGPLVSQYIIIQ